LKRTSAFNRSSFCRAFLLAFGFFFFYAVSFLTAQSESGDGEDIITTISISGLKRTRLSTAERPLHKFIGLKTDEVDEDEVRAAVLSTGVLEPVLIETEGHTLSVTVREKWAIFPIPVFMAGSGGIMAGLAFFDANAFGLADKFFLAGLYQTNAWTASSGYVHSSPGGRIPGWNAMGAFSRGEQYNRNQNNEVLRRFDYDEFSFNGGINIPLLKDSDLFNASTQVSYDSISLRNTGEAFNGPDEGLQTFGAGEELSVRKSRWDGYFLSQEAASLRYSCRIPLDGSSLSHSVRFQGTWEQSLVPGFRLSMRTGLLFDPDAPVVAESSPFVSQVAILPHDFSARNYAGLSVGLEKCIFKVSFGTLSVLAAYQLVYSQGSILGNSFDHGCLGMLTFYLNRLAIPALGAGITYNIDKNYFQASFALGITF